MNLARPIRLADLAARAELSPYHFVHAFKISTGATPRAFVERRRVELARRLVRESRSPTRSSTSQPQAHAWLYAQHVDWHEPVVSAASAA